MENAVNPVGFKATQLLDSATIDNIARAYASAKSSCLATSIVWSSQDLDRVIKPIFAFGVTAVHCCKCLWGMAMQTRQ
jgi:hypothetical protein